MAGEEQREEVELTKAKGKDDGEKAASSSLFIYVLTCFATLGGLLFGYDIGIVSGSMLLIQPYFALSTAWQELIVSGTIGSAAIFALCGGYLADKIGRKYSIMFASLVFIAGAIVMAASPTKEVLLVGRIVVGVGVGVASMSVPVYIAESSPISIRGLLVTLNQLFITIGILLSSIIAGAFSSMKTTGWRYMLGLSAVPAVLQFVGFLFLPESPRFLVDRGRHQQARDVLARIRETSDVTDELNEIIMSKQEADSIGTGGGFVLKDVLRTPHVRKAMLIGASLSFIQQACGINTVIYYSGTILKMAGFPADQAIWLVVVPNAVNFLATFLGIYAVERLGRRPLILASIAGVIGAEVVLAVSFQVAAGQAPRINASVPHFFGNGSLVTQCQGYTTCDSCVHNMDCGFCYEPSDVDGGSCLPSGGDGVPLGETCNQTVGAQAQHYTQGFCPSSVAWAAVLGMVLFVLAFAPGLGPMPWTINSEIYPLWARSTCNAISSATCWVLNLVVSFTFLTLTETISRHGTFWLFGGVSLCGLIFFFACLPETRGHSLEEVEELFMPPAEREARKQKRQQNLGYGALKDAKEEDGSEKVTNT